MKDRSAILPRPAGLRALMGAAALALVVGGFAPAGQAAGQAGAFTQPAFGFQFWQPFWNHLWRPFRNHFGPGKGEAPEFSEPAASCGYAVRNGTYSAWPFGYKAWVEIKNVSGETATDFQVLLDVGDTEITHGKLAEYEQTDDGYRVSAPHWLKWRKIRPGDTYRFHFTGRPQYEGVTPYIISINGETCDTEPPQVNLAASDSFFNAEDTLTLTAEASDNAAVRKVVFEKGGEVVGRDSEAPFELEVDVTEALNGFHLYSATAYDPSGNEATSDPARVFVSIDNKFFGTAPGGEEDYEHLLTYFDQLTPENAGKWGSVESERDVMDWTALDNAYTFAQNNGLRFKFHTLTWGQQQPDWIGDLSAEEQLAELEEWMAAVAERYPDLEMIEVVNEPLHETPEYAEALGGAGETGYDWVITAFEMAREHFPEAQLILNDYQILHLPNFVEDYMEVIEPLQERGLIDAIGVQAHFLERTQASMVQQNLDTLADTGLPIYASEFDLNFADDARQANVMADLFPVFWEHPAVVGVTHWGHLEGSIWRENAYLVNADDTERPALEWLVCYLAGGGDSCTVPEYVPGGWQGDEFGVTLPGELYDEGEGIVALGEVAAFTNAGDWIRYFDVEFQDGWDTFWITFARGLDEDNGATMTVHLDSLDNAPVMTIDAEYTGGWGSSTTVERDLSVPAGTHDVYIRFNEDEEAVANLDSVRFGKPRPDTGVNLVVDGGFEGDSVAEGWNSWTGSSFGLTTAPVHTGNQSLQVSNREDNGVAAYDLTGDVNPDTVYSVSAQALHTGASEDTIRMAAVVECTEETAPEDHNAFPWLHNNEGVAPNEWVQLSGNLEVPDCDLTNVQVYFEGTSGGVDVYLDELTVTPPGENLVGDGGFETGVGAWHAFGSGSTLTAVTDRAFAGDQSLLVTDRSGTGGFVGHALTGQVEPGTDYTVRAQVLHNGAEADTVRLVGRVTCTAETTPEDHNEFPWLDNNTAVEPETWTELSGTLSIPDGCEPSDIQIFFEGTAETSDVYLDEVSVLAN